jgi:hypothetical protein
MCAFAEYIVNPQIQLIFQKNQILKKEFEIFFSIFERSSVELKIIIQNETK